MMKIFTLAALLLVPGLLPATGVSARSHTIRLSGDTEKDEYRFTPGRITAAPGDTLVFMVESGAPHALGVDPAGLSARVKEAWNQALPGRTGALRSPMLRKGQPYRVVVPRGMPAGKYLFFCLTHRAYDMRLELEIKP